MILTINILTLIGIICIMYDQSKIVRNQRFLWTCPQELIDTIWLHKDSEITLSVTNDHFWSVTVIKKETKT